ncbi:MAG: TonB-dependent receptor [Myxococcales bacterium]|nr:TonB-dependent receptor [Myxococcales bacterium]
MDHVAPWLVTFTLLAFIATSAQAQLKGAPKPGDSPQILLEEFEIDARNVVLSAAKVKTTIQEAPQIITVITEKELHERGFRTINEVLQHVPGFHGDRWEGHGWFKESFARGIPRGLLVLINGINIVEPMRNTITLDYKIPLEMIRRIEVTSGPGGVLWGSNALLGIVNIITKDGKNNPGLVVSAGYGTGPGEVNAIKVSAAYGASFFKDLLKIYVNVTYFTSQGPRLKTDVNRIYGMLPEPNNSWSVKVINESATPKFLNRSHWLSTFAKVDIGKFSLEVSMPYEFEYLHVSPGGTHLTMDFTNLANIGANHDLVTRSEDWVRWASLKYKDRFWKDRFGLSVNTYWVDWRLGLVPFGIYPKGSIAPNGVKTWIDIERIYRVGANVDMDLRLPGNHHLLFGGEFFFTEFYNARSRNFSASSLSTATSCPAPYQLRPDIDPVRPCVVFEKTAFDTRRSIGALFLVDEWRLFPQLILSAGVRGQFSDSYDAAVLFSGGLVWNVWKKIYIKANYAEGFRPPDFQSTHLNPNVTGQVTFLPNRDLKVETSRAIESEINMVLLENVSVIRRLYIRTSYAFTLMNNVINRVQGRFVNSGDRELHTLEFLLRMTFKGDHEFWLGYYMFFGQDSKTGAIRNMPNHTITAGFRAHLYKKYLELVSTIVVRGGMEDRNLQARPLYEPGRTDPYNVSKKDNVEYSEFTNADAEVTRIPPAIILNVGLRVKNFWKDHLEISAFVYNVANLRYKEPDLFFDARSFGQPTVKPQISFFVAATFRYF